MAASRLHPLAAARRWYRAASGWLLFCAGLQLSMHIWRYVQTDSFEPRRQALQQTLEAYSVFAPTGATMWTVLSMFSLSYGLLLAFWATGHWILALECELAALRRHALRQALFCALLCLLLGLYYPLPYPVLTFAVAALLYAVAYGRRAGDALRPGNDSTQHEV